MFPTKNISFMAALLFLVGTFQLCPAQQPIKISHSQQLSTLPTKIIPRDTMVRVSYDEGWLITVQSLRKSALVPVDAHDDDSEHLLLFSGPVGDYLVLGFNPEAKPRSLYQMVVRIQENPNPNPDPDPTPDPDPPIPPPVPSNIPNAYGLGLPSYTESIKLPPSQCTQLSTAFARAIEQLGEQSATLSTALTQVRDVRKSFGTGWNNWEIAVETALTNAIQQNRTIPMIQQYFIEIQMSLDLAAKQPRTVRKTRTSNVIPNFPFSVSPKAY